MLTLPGYRLNPPLRADKGKSLYRGVELSTGRPVIVYVTADIKTVDLQEYAATAHDPAYQYPYQIERCEEGCALIYEDLGQKCLVEYMRGAELDWADFFSIASQCALTVATLHESGHTNLQLTPEQIWVCPDSKVRLLSVPRSHDLPFVPLAYFAPEQLGWSPQPADHRSDLYTLGLLFYEWLAGRPPFEAHTPAEWAHAHRVARPVPMNRPDRRIPELVAEIVMVLLSKQADDRYQSARGLSYDLSRCHEAWRQSGELTPFALRSRDESGVLRNQPFFYGREAELEELLSAYARIAAGTAEFWVVKGIIGSGKSALVQEFGRRLSGTGAWFAYEGCDESRNGSLLAPIAQVIKELLRPVLSRESDEVQGYKDRLLQAVGQSGRILTDAIPDLKRLIGEQPETAQLNAVDATSQFHTLMLKMLQSLATREHPLVIVMDGLQGVDQASANLVRYLFEHRRTMQYVLILGVARTGTLEPMFPEILHGDGSGVPPTVIELEPLDFFHVHKWLAATLHSEPAAVLPLAELLFQKTGGNPLYLHQLLRMVYEERWLRFDFKAYRWVWNPDKIRENHLGDDVHHLMTGRYERLPALTRRALRVASCMGHRFSLRLLAVCMDATEAETNEVLLPAIEQRIILALEDDDQSLSLHAEAFAFVHDQLQLEAYHGLSAAERKSIHLRVGRILRDTAPENPEGDSLFQIVYHLNLGSEYISGADEKRDLAERNLHAGIRAKRAGAFELGLSLLKAGELLLRPEGWERHYRLSYHLWLELAECEYICGNSSKAEVIFEFLKPKAQSRQDRATLCKLEMRMYLLRSEIDSAIAIGLQGMAEYGLQINRNPSRAALLTEVVLTRLLARHAFQGDMAILADPEWKALDEILELLVPLTFLHHPNLFAVAISKYARLMIKRRRQGISPGGLAVYAALLFVGFGDYRWGHRLAELAMELSRRQPLRDVNAGTQLAYAFTAQFIKDVAGSKPLFAQTVTAAMERGELSNASLALGGLWNATCAHGTLYELQQYMAQFQETVIRVGEPIQMKHYQIVKQFCLALQGQTRSRTAFDSASFDEASFVRELNQTAGIRSELYAYYAFRIQLCYLFDQPAEAVRLMEEAVPYQQYAGHTITELEQVCFRFLSLAAVYSEATAGVRRLYRRSMRKQLTQMRKWTRIAPNAARHKFELMKAEWSRLFGRTEQSNRHYELAIIHARNAGYLKWEGIANQRTALNCSQHGRQTLAEYCMQQALTAFAAWGATAKVKHLQSQYPGLLKGVPVEVQNPLRLGNDPLRRTPDRTTKSANEHIRKELDWELLRQAASIGSDSEGTADVYGRLLSLAVRVAGAEEGCLLLLQQGRLTVVAQSNSLTDSYTEVYSKQIVTYALRTLEPLVLEKATQSAFADEPYIRSRQPSSVLCLPIRRGAQPLGALYLEHHWLAGAFTPDRLDALQLILAQIASLQNPGRAEDKLQVTEREPDAQHQPDDLVMYESLTEREKEVLRYIVRGLSNKEIAQQLFLTEGTVKNYVFHIFGKLQVTRRIQAVNKAKALSLLD